MRRLLNRDKQLESTALISSGGHTFVVHRRFLMHDDDPAIEIYVMDSPPHEGELSIYRRGPQLDGPFGVEYYGPGEWPMPIERALWWVHALHAMSRLAEELNSRQTN